MFWFPCTIVTILIVYLIRDYFGPREILLKVDNAWGLACLRAKDLLVQSYDSQGNLWATRGMVAYQLSEEQSKFVRQCHIPTGFSVFWLRNFSFVRRLLLRPECVEILPLPRGGICAMSAGRMWHRTAQGVDFEETLTLRHYGIGTGQGIFHDGLCRLSDGTVIFGEYFTNRDKTAVRLYASQDNGRTWQVAHEFRPGQIRHVHAVQQDPYTQKAWICTGDSDIESMVAWTRDNGKTLNPIGQGSRVWCVCQLVFTKEALFWGAEGQSTAVSGIYKWNRKSHELTKLVNTPGEIFYATRLAGGTIVMSTVCGGAPSEKDDRTRLFIVTDENKVTLTTCGTRDSKKRYAKLRFQRDQGGASLFMTCLGHKEFNDGDLIIISEEALRAAAEKAHSQPSCLYDRA